MARLLRAGAGIASALFVAALVLPASAAAHGLAAKEDLPIPVWLFIWAAAIVLIVSFVVLSVAWREPKLQEERDHPAPGWLSKALLNPATEAIAGGFGVFLLGVVIYAGLEGIDAPDLNFAPVFVFVTFFLGGVLFSVLFGDFFRAFNPWRAIGRFFGGIVRLVSGQQAPAPLAYPERLGHWPAGVGLVAFGWLELIYGVGSVGVSPNDVAVAALIYTGDHPDLHGAVRDRGLDRARRDVLGLLQHVLAALAGDGRAREAGFSPPALRCARTGATCRAPWGWCSRRSPSPPSTGPRRERSPARSTRSFDFFRDDIGLSISLSFRVTDSIFILLVIAAVFGLFRLGLWGMTPCGTPPRSRSSGGSSPTR